ncbi:N-acetylserotonin O-methyltransferase-like protein-like protein [Syncephalis plumigaleata]|nr:N-acetylserotonin O-methyltransferase-like protein-like protein [Syncephalis plumigaleata]
MTSLPTMSLPSLAALHGKRVVLASTSPRRREILSLLGISFDVEPSLFEENLDKSLFAHPRDYVMENARCKAAEVFERSYRQLVRDSSTTATATSKETIPRLIIGADTVVVLDNQILEKPRSREQAVNMLRSLRGREHYVYTGVSFILIKEAGYDVHTFYEETTVVMTDFSDADLEAYVNTGDPMDKAGAYGIQSLASCFIKGINGDFRNVAGLPLSRIYTELITWLSLQNSQ